MLSPIRVSRSRRQGTIWIFGGSVAFVSILMSLLIGVPLLGADPKALEAADSSSIEGIENPQHLPMLLELKRARATAAQSITNLCHALFPLLT